MGESFQDYSWIQDFEADFPGKSASKSWIQQIIIGSVCLKTTDHLNFKLWIFSGNIASFKIRVLKFQGFRNFEL